MNTDIQMNLPRSGGTSWKHFLEQLHGRPSESLCELPPHPSKSHYVKPQLASLFLIFNPKVTVSNLTTH